MTRRLLESTLLLLMISLPVATAADPQPPVRVVPFGPGEELVYAIDYGPVNAGEAVLKIVDTLDSGGERCYRVENTIRSNRVFSALYRVRDKAVSHFSVSDLTSRYFSKRLREGDYRRNVEVVFDQDLHTATYTDGREYPIAPEVHDVLSATYQMRTIDLLPGTSSHLTVHSSRQDYDLEVIVQGRETISVPAGTFDCYVVEPVFMGEGLFQYEGKLTFWVSADSLRIPVQIKTKVKVGAINAVLRSFTAGEPLDAGARP